VLQRVKNIETNGRVSVVADEWSEDWTRLRWVRLDGLATILESGAEHDRAIALLEAKYPQYRELPLAGRPIVRIAVEGRTEWHAGQERS
jgi:PPOX class probable F420-dependent enzyme